MSINNSLVPKSFKIWRKEASKAKSMLHAPKFSLKWSEREEKLNIRMILKKEVGACICPCSRSVSATGVGNKSSSMGS